MNEYGWLTEGAELPEAGELLYHGSGAAPVYLIANESDIMPNTQVTVTAADGPALWVKKAGSVTVTLPAGTASTLTSPFSAYGTALSPSPRTARCTTSPFTPKALCVKQPPEPPNPQQIARF